jgi:hypothetical protein
MMDEGGARMKATLWLGCMVFLVAALNGCTDNRQSFFVRFITMPSEGECVVPSDRNANYRTTGMLDLSVKDTYQLFPLLENDMTNSTELNPLTAESNRITVEGAQVRVTNEAGDAVGGGDFFVPFSTTVDPGNVSAVGFNAIPPGYLGSIVPGETVIVEFKVLGTTGGGVEIDTPWFSFPVSTCADCLAQFPEGTWDAENGCYDCSATSASGLDPCNPGQDEFYNCCQVSTAACLAERC